MPLWLIYASIAYLLWAVTSLVDKVLLNKKFKKPLVYAVVGTLFQIVVYVSLAFQDFSLPPTDITLLGLLGGSMSLLSLSIFFKALSLDDASTVIPLLAITPVYVLLFSFLFLGHQPSHNELLAFTFFLLGGILLALQNSTLKKINLSPAFAWSTFASWLFAIQYTLWGYVFERVDKFDGYILIRSGAIVTALVLLMIPMIKREASKIIRSSKKLLPILFVNVCIALVGQFYLNAAISEGKVALVNAAQSIQHVSVFLFGLILSRYLPKLIKENTSRTVVLRKITALVCISIAVAVINLKPLS